MVEALLRLAVGLCLLALCLHAAQKLACCAVVPFTEARVHLSDAVGLLTIVLHLEA